MAEGLYTVFDQKAKWYPKVIQARNDDVARRLFKSAVAQDSEFSQHPEDYHLFRIGEFDQEKGRLVDELPQLVVSAWDLKFELSEEAERGLEATVPGALAAADAPGE